MRRQNLSEQEQADKTKEDQQEAEQLQMYMARAIAKKLIVSTSRSLSAETVKRSENALHSNLEVSSNDGVA